MEWRSIASFDQGGQRTAGAGGLAPSPPPNLQKRRTLRPWFCL